MAEAVQHPRAGAQRRDGRAVLLLIEEEAGLLAVLHVHAEDDAVLLHLHQVGHLAAQEARGLLHALQAAHRHVAALPDAHGLDDLHQKIGDHVLDALDAQRQALQHQHVRILIHHQARQEVGFGVDQAAAVRVAELPAVVPSVPDAAGEELAVADFVVAGEDAQGNLALGIVEAPADELSAEVVHVHDVAVFECAVHLLNFRCVDPGMSAANAGFAGLA